MEFRVLGPVAVRVANDEVRIGASKLRLLLARLILAGRAPVGAERLIEDLWEGDPPRSAAQTLQTYVSQLRKIIGSERVVTEAGGYRVVVNDGELDSARFESELAAGHRAMAGGDASEAVTLLDGALMRWRGPAFLDATGVSWAQAEIARLDELRLAATETLLEAHLALGDDARVVAVAEAAVAEHPLRERLWASLMTALYRQGRQADALRAYQRLRTQLVDELGIEPSRELRELEAKLLRQEDTPTGEGDAGSAPQPIAGPLPTGVVTFLLTDIVGSTRLWENSAGRMAHEVARHETLLRTAVEGRAGFVLKARGEGDSTFSVFQRASDAVAAAAAVVDAIGVAGLPFAIRLAVHSGEAVERDRDYYGRTVNRAARLRSAAPPNQVLLSQATADLVVDDLPPGCRLHPLGLQELRDLDRPESVFVLAPVGDTTGSAVTEGLDVGEGPVRRVPLPSRAAAVPTAGLVGRVAEREVLRRAYDRACGGRGTVALIAGEPGVGKTSLAADLASTAFAGGATVLFGRCDEGLGLPYQPWVEMLTHLVTNVGDDVLDRLGDRRLADLARLVPAVLDRRPQLPPPARGDVDGDRWALFNAVQAVVAAADTPLVLVFDDLQWADRPSLALLRHVVADSTYNEIFVAGTYRDGELGADHPLMDTVAALGKDAFVERLVVRGLVDDELVALVEALTGQALPPDSLSFVHAVRRETDGNPFFATELLRHLAESGGLYLDDAGRWVPRGPLDTIVLPETIREVIRSRARKLGSEAERLLKLAAVIGQEFDLDTLSVASRLDAQVTVDLLERSEAAGLVVAVEAGRFAFAHALVAHSLASELTTTRRAVEHRRIAQAIEDLAGAVPDNRSAELARHWAAATPADGEKAAHYARMAGDGAMRALAPDEAVRWYANALEHVGTGDSHARCDLLVRLGRAQRDAGDNEHRATLLDAGRAAQRVGADDLLVRAALANTRGFVGTVDPLIAERVALLDDALLRTTADDPATRSRLLATLGVERRGMDPSFDASAITEESIALARSVGDGRLLAHVLNSAFFALWLPDTLDLRLALSTEACQLADRLGDAPLLHWSATWRVHVLVEAGRVDEAADWLDVLDQAAAEAGSPSLQWLGPSLRAGLCALHGEIAAARRHADTSYRRAVALTERDALAVRLAVLAVCAWHEGSDDPEITALERHPEFHDATWQVTVAGRSYWTAERALVGQTGDADIRAWLDEWVDDRGGRGVGAVGYACVLAERCHDVGTRDHAARLLPWLARYRGQVATMGSHWMGATAYYAGILAALLDELDEADVYFAEADEMNDAIRAPFFLARTRLARAQVRLRRRGSGDAPAARAELQSALALARAHECAVVEREAERLLATCG